MYWIFLLLSFVSIRAATNALFCGVLVLHLLLALFIDTAAADVVDYGKEYDLLFTTFPITTSHNIVPTNSKGV